MGPKKRNLATRSKPSSPASVSSSAAAACLDGGGGGNDAQSDKQQPQTECQDPNFLAIKVECEKALTAFRRGNHTKALRVIRDACHKYDKSALAHRFQGTICVKVAGIIDDQNAKARHLKNGIESARTAVNLSPNSVEFSHFYANLLCDTAREAKEYDEVVQECERALAIENPIDPAKESLSLEQKIPTAEGRITHMQQELRSLIQKANISSLSSWMKHLGTGSVDDKFRLFPIRRSPEDPMEARFGEPRRPNEIKKATKTPEERRKEIEVKVAAARIVQQNSESSSPLLLTDEKNKVGELNTSGGGSVNGHKAGERRKHGSNRKNASLPERKDQVKSYWNSMSFEKKKDLLSIGVGDMRTHYSSMKDGLAGEVLSEALSFCEVSKSWKFWICCRCGEKYPNGEALMQHVAQEHLGSLMPKMQSVLPQCIDDDQAERLLNCSWKPLDFGASVGMFEYQPKLEDGGFTIKFYNCSENDEGKSKNCWTDSYCTIDSPDSLSGEKSSVDCCNWSLFDGKENDKEMHLDCMACDGKQVTKVYTLPNSWPLSDDSERAKLLEKISSMLQLLIAHKCFAINHLHKVIQFAVDELQGMAPGWPPLRGDLDQTPLCICFLGAGQLRKILKFLQDISHACGVGRYSDKIAEDASSHCHGSGFEDKLVLSGDSSCLLLDDNLLPNGGPTSNTGNDAQCTNSLLSWIYAGPPVSEDLGTWSRVQEEKIQQATEFLQMLVKEFGHLQSVCDRKFEHLSYEEALHRLEDLCVDERKKREHATEFSICSYESVLRKRREELLADETDVAYIRNRFEVDAIDNVLKEAESINVNQFGYEEPYVGLTSHLCDLEAGEDDDWKSKDYLQQVDTCVEVAIRTLRDQLSLELSKIDARLLRNINIMQELELKLESISTLDYISIVLPLVKSFMRAHLEDLAEKDATEKSDAAREAFLAELALDSKKNVGGGRDTSSRRSHEKIKDKKRTKDTRKSKDTKIGSLNKNLENTGDESYFAFTNVDDGNSEPAVVIPDPADDVKRMEEEFFQRKIELEAEERKLEETLENQRRMEKEAKQKHLAELRKRNAQASLGHSVEGLNDVPVQPDGTYYGHHKETLAPENGFHNNLEGFSRNAAGGDATLSKLPSNDLAKNGNSCQSLDTKQGLLNGGIKDGRIKEKDGLHIEQRTRRGRRRSSTKLQDHGLSEKENPNVWLTPVDIEQNGQVINNNCVPGANGGDGGSKTLRELHAEEDDEERFQADLARAVRQSLDSFQAPHKLPLVANLRVQNISQQAEQFSSSGQATIDNEKHGTGLQNEVGEYNCFLNVIIQSLWHLRRFREEFLSQPMTKHVHVGDPCVVCALSDILNAMSEASYGTEGEAVAPTSLRVALSNLYPESNFFQEGQMNDASEVLAVIFDCLHRGFTHAWSASDDESVESTCLGTWDCSNSACIAHSLFGMDIFERMNCYNCNLESRHLKYTSFFHNINASALRTMKAMCTESKFDELLNLVEMNHQLACDPEASGCGKFNHIHHILSTPPHVFTTVLGWQNTCENVDDIRETLDALATDIDISVLYRGLDPKNLHRLVSVVCYYGQHYHCFAYSQDSKQWIMYDDNVVKVIGTWEDILNVCVRGHLQPQVLFYEAVH